MRDKDETKATPLVKKIKLKSKATTTSIKDETARKPLREAGSKVKVMLTLFSVFAYIALFLLIHYMQDYGTGVVAVIPVIVVAWLYGSVPGICVGLLTLLVNILMYEYLGVDWMERMILKGASIPGTIAYMLMGAVVGRLSDLSTRVKRELSHRKQAEDALKKAHDELEFRVIERTEELKKVKDHLDNVIESSLDGIVIGDSTGNIISANGTFLKMVDYQEEEIKGMHVMELSITEKGTYESTTGESVEIDEGFFNDAKKMTYEKLFEEGKITDWENYYLRKDKKIVPVEMTISYLYSAEGDIVGSVGINRDITERKKAEKEI